MPGKGETNRLVPLKTVCPNPEGFGECYNRGAGAGFLIRIEVCAGSDGLLVLMSFWFFSLE